MDIVRSMRLRTLALLVAAIVVGFAVILLAGPVMAEPALRGAKFNPNYDAQFSGDITGGGPVAFRGDDIHSDTSRYDFRLVFSPERSELPPDVAAAFEGVHFGILSITVYRDGITGFSYVFEPEETVYSALNCHIRNFESSKKSGTLTFSLDGATCSFDWIDQSNPPPVWGEGLTWWFVSPGFTVVGTKQ